MQINNAFALPYVVYCSVLWQEYKKELQQSVERILNYEMHIILAKLPRTHSDELRQALKWMRLSTRRRLSRMTLVHRCLNPFSSLTGLKEMLSMVNKSPVVVVKCIYIFPKQNSTENSSHLELPKIGMSFQVSSGI